MESRELTGEERRALYEFRRSFGPINNWFTEWARYLAAGNGPMLVSLLHWGLDLFFNPIMVCHYLTVADRHRATREKSWAKGSDLPAEVAQQVSAKAWQELCNRLFVLFKEDDLKYGWMFSDLAVARAMIWFVDPARHDYNHLSNFGAPRWLESSYDRKAKNFLRIYLKWAWESNSNPYQFRSEPPDSLGDLKELCDRVNIFHRQERPKLVEIMAEHRHLDILEDQRLDAKTRRALRKLALTSRNAFKGEKLSTLEGALVKDTSRYPDAAKILLLYQPWVRAQAAKMLAEHRAEQKRWKWHKEQEIKQARVAAREARQRLRELAGE